MSINPHKLRLKALIKLCLMLFQGCNLQPWSLLKKSEVSSHVYAVIENQHSRKCLPTGILSVCNRGRGW